MRSTDEAVTRSGRRRVGFWLAALAVAFIAAWVWQGVARRRAPEPGRGEMYQRTLENLRAFCDPPKPELESYCREQAGAVLDFPECDADCVSLARRVRHEPTR
jgi:hypothetical protein